MGLYSHRLFMYLVVAKIYCSLLSSFAIGPFFSFSTDFAVFGVIANRTESGRTTGTAIAPNASIASKISHEQFLTQPYT